MKIQQHRSATRLLRCKKWANTNIFLSGVSVKKGRSNEISTDTIYRSTFLCRGVLCAAFLCQTAYSGGTQNFEDAGARFFALRPAVDCQHRPGDGRKRT